MSIQTLPNTGPNNVPIIPLPAAAPETAITHSPSEHYNPALDFVHPAKIETTGDYQVVNLSSRPPLLKAGEVDVQTSGRGGMLGDLVAVIQEPNPTHFDMDAADIPKAATANQIYVFRHNNYGASGYTIMGTAALGRFVEGRPNPEGAMVHLGPGDHPLHVGNQEGNWLPSTGFDRSQLAENKELARAARPISREQGRFVVDGRGDLYYEEAATRTNAAMIEMRRTPNEEFRDAARAQETEAINNRLDEERFEAAKTVVQERYVGGRTARLDHQGQRDENKMPPMLANKGALYGQRLHTPYTDPKLHGGRLTDERYKGQHRRAGFLGKIASKIFG